jgi:hypothetical protein
MDLTVWLPAMILSAVAAFALIFGFVFACDKV